MQGMEEEEEEENPVVCLYLLNDPQATMTCCASHGLVARLQARCFPQAEVRDPALDSRTYAASLDPQRLTRCKGQKRHAKNRRQRYRGQGSQPKVTKPESTQNTLCGTCAARMCMSAAFDEAGAPATNLR